jgi:hypothetical protein
MKSHTFKGWYHAALVAAAVAEVFSAKTNLRRLLLGGCAGWHLYAVYEHFMKEPDEVDEVAMMKLGEPVTYARQVWLKDIAEQSKRAEENFDKLRTYERNTWGWNE